MGQAVYYNIEEVKREENMCNTLNRIIAYRVLPDKKKSSDQIWLSGYLMLRYNTQAEIPSSSTGI